MQEQSTKPPMDDYDKALVDHFNKFAELEKAGKIKYLSREEVSANTKKIIEQARAEQNKQLVKAYRNKPGYAI